MNVSYTLTSRSGLTRTVVEFPWASRNNPIPWDNEKYARVMIPFTEVEQRNYKYAQNHMQIVSRDRLVKVTPSVLKLS